MTGGFLLGAAMVFGLASAWAGPSMLQRARWQARAPRAALALWFAFAVAALIATVGVILSVGIRPWRMALLPGLRRALWCLVECRWGAFSPLQLTLVVLALGLGIQFVLLLANEFRRTALERRKHRRVLGLVAAPLSGDDGMLLLEHPAPVAYGVPGLRPRVVLSTGTLSLLNERELQAVLAHERAHFRARHDLAVLPFAALASALPWLPLARDGLASVRALVEMLADDAAARRESTTAVAAAIVHVARGAVPAGALAGGGGNVARRVQRLSADRQTARLWITPLAYGAACVIAAVPCALLVAASTTLR